MEINPRLVSMVSFRRFLEVQEASKWTFLWTAHGDWCHHRCQMPWASRAITCSFLHSTISDRLQSAHWQSRTNLSILSSGMSLGPRSRWSKVRSSDLSSMSGQRQEVLGLTLKTRDQTGHRSPRHSCPSPYLWHPLTSPPAVPDPRSVCPALMHCHLDSDHPPSSLTHHFCVVADDWNMWFAGEAELVEVSLMALVVFSSINHHLCSILFVLVDYWAFVNSILSKFISVWHLKLMWFLDLNMYLEKRLLGKLMQTVSVSQHVRPMWWSNYWDGDAIPRIQVSVLWCWEHIALFLLQVWVRVSMSCSPATLFYWIVVPLRCQSGTTGISSWIGKGGMIMYDYFLDGLWLFIAVEQSSRVLETGNFDES